MTALSRCRVPDCFHHNTSRRMYRFDSSGEIGEPCGMPRCWSRLRVVRCLRPRSSVSSTGASIHTLIRCRICRSVIRRATDFTSLSTSPASRCAPDAAASTASLPAFVTMANAPLVGWDGQSSRCDLGRTKTEIFLQRGLDSPVDKPPDGQITTRRREHGHRAGARCETAVLNYATNGEVACQKLATKSGRSSCAFEKWIDDGEPAETAAVLHVFREQRVAAGLDCGGDDQRIVER